VTLSMQERLPFWKVNVHHSPELGFYR